MSPPFHAGRPTWSAGAEEAQVVALGIGQPVAALQKGALEVAVWAGEPVWLARAFR
jgi:hypothetical protein